MYGDNFLSSRFLGTLHLLLALNLTDQVLAGVYEAFYAVHDASFFAASKTAARCPSDASVKRNEM